MLDKSKSEGKGMKVGDKVKVVGNQGGNCWKVGHVGWILELSEDDCRVSNKKGGPAVANWYVYEDLELVEEETKKDNVNHPSHYGNGSIECIDYLEDFLTKEEFIGYLRGNIGKYLHRWRYKNGLEDLRKAEWYLNKLMGVMKDET